MISESKSLPERIAGIYYSHGVCCAAHPVPVILLAVSTVLLSCIPLINLPLASNVPQIYVESRNSTNTDQPKWFTDTPVYVQQVVLKSAVSPWTKDMVLTDAIRAPLAEVFRLIEAVQNYKHSSGTILTNICTHVEAPTRSSLPLPQYNCLVVSPANFWRQDPSRFYTDISLVSTVYGHTSVQVGKANLPELLFGMSLKEAGFKRYPLRNRQRVIQYAVTIFLNEYDTGFIEGLHRHLKALYPGVNNQNSTSSHQKETTVDNPTVHIYHRGDFDFHEFLPLFFTYLMLFFYMYFSVRKIELVRYKFRVSLAAVFTVVASLVMSIGICLFFGLDPAGSSRGREVFPYLVVVVGLENILVLTKSVVSTQAHLDAKIRVAQGLSKEGWEITKNLLTELTILTIGLFTLVPSIQEFCIFAMVGLLCDFFLQMCFFSTVLSLDVRGLEEASDGMVPRLRDYATPATRNRSGSSSSSGSLLKSCKSMSSGSLTRTRSVPRLDCHIDDSDRVPKRLRLVLFWGRTRIVQRAFMLCMIVWIGGFVYSAGIVQHLVPSHPQGQVRDLPPGHILGKYRSLLGKEGEATILARQSSKSGDIRNGYDEVLLNQPDSNLLQPVKWCYLSHEYNWTSGQQACRLAVLPPIRLGCIIPPSRAAAVRNPLEPPQQPFKWHSLAQALDPVDIDQRDTGTQLRGWETPYLPTSPLEVLLVTALCMISVVVMAYTSLALYHCVCSRNYAQWRTAWSSWYSGEAGRDRRGSSSVDDAESSGYSSSSTAASQVVLQAVPLVLEGQGQYVEWVASDGSTVCCSYLSGDVNVWDASSGERLSHIDRKSYFSRLECDSLSLSSEEPLTLDDSFRRSKKSLNDEHEVPLVSPNRKTFPDLKLAINTNFSQGSGGSGMVLRDYSETGYDYGPTIRMLYSEEGEWDEDAEEGLFENCPPIWCVDSADNLIAVGTSCGRVEFWEATTGKLKGVFDDNGNVGVTCVKMVSSRCVVARLNGTLEVLTIEWHCPGGSNLAYRRGGAAGGGGGHYRAASTGGLELGPHGVGDGIRGGDNSNSSDELRIFRGKIVRAHQQPINVLQAQAGRIMTGSRDHTLKVFSLIDELLVFTLHGHCGPITALFIDTMNPLTAGSGSQDGMVCVWDLLTGACVYSLDAHDGPVTAMTHSSSYVISLGTDEKLCVWDRFQGHLLNTIQLSQAYCTGMAMLTHNLLITSKQGSLVIWDVRTGDPMRLVKLGHNDSTVAISTILPLRDSVVCDYGHSLRIVRFPLVRDKTD